MANRQKIDDNKITEEGSYFNEWYGYKSMGIILNDAAMLDENGNTIPVLTNNDKAGNIRYQDIDGDGKITASADRVRLGNSLPEMQYGGSRMGGSRKRLDHVFLYFWLECFILIKKILL